MEGRMTGRTLSGPTTRRAICVYLLLGLVVGALRSQAATADCVAKDFDQHQIFAAINEVNDSVANLRALQNSPTTDQTSILMLTIMAITTDRAAAETSLFAGYLTIYRGLVSNQDRVTTNNYIRAIAKVQFHSLKTYADYLTVNANNFPQYAGEIRHARDRVRKLMDMFSCADTGSGQ